MLIDKLVSPTIQYIFNSIHIYVDTYMVRIIVSLVTNIYKYNGFFFEHERVRQDETWDKKIGDFFTKKKKEKMSILPGSGLISNYYCL